MRGPPRRPSGSPFGIGRGVLAPIVGDQWRHRVRGLPGQSLKNRPECNSLGMEVRCELVPCQRRRDAGLRHRAQDLQGHRLMTAGVLQDIDRDSPPTAGFTSFQGGNLGKLGHHGPGLLSCPTPCVRITYTGFLRRQDMHAGLTACAPRSLWGPGDGAAAAGAGSATARAHPGRPPLHRG